jgi:BMFP domain-containing protein YqiC
MISWLLNYKYVLASIKNDVEILKRRIEALEAKIINTKPAQSKSNNERI